MKENETAAWFKFAERNGGGVIEENAKEQEDIKSKVCPLLKAKQQLMGSPFRIENSLIDAEDTEILGFVEDDKTFIALAQKSVFGNEEMSAAKKDDFFTEGKARGFLKFDLYIRSKPNEFFRYLREDIFKRKQKASGGA